MTQPLPALFFPGGDKLALTSSTLSVRVSPQWLSYLRSVAKRSLMMKMWYASRKSGFPKEN